MYRFIVAILLGCILYSSASLAQSSNPVTEKPEFVMILSSYSYEKEWSTAIAKEIRNRLEMERPEIKVNITYAGITAHTSYLADRFAMQGAFAYGRLNNRIFLPDVLVLIGDESWMLYRTMNHRGTWERIPVILCGVHEDVMEDYNRFFPDKQIQDSLLIPLNKIKSDLKTMAVIEPDNTARTLQLAETLVPGFQHLYYLSDGSYCDSYVKKKLMQCSEKAGVSFSEILIEPDNEDSVKQVLRKLPGESVLVTNSVLPPKSISVPVLTLRDMTYRTHIPSAGYFAPVSAFADKTVENIFRLLETGVTAECAYAIASDTAFYLNSTALMHAGLRSAVKNLPNAVERNIPPHFVIRHIRIIVVILLVIIVLAFVSARIIYSRRYRYNLNSLLERYKTLYDEYQLVYENMPVGLMLFDIYGNLLNRNAETDVFFEQFAHARADIFHLFNSDILDEKMREALYRKELVSRLIVLNDYCYRFQCCMIPDEETGENNYLVIVIDNTDIVKERKAKEKIYNVLNFAMDKAVIGVAEYNLLDGLGFATDAWYGTFNMQRKIVNLLQAHQYLVEDDRIKVEQYLERVRYGASFAFCDNLQIQNPNGENHYIRYLIQPLEYAPDVKHIIVAELVLNVDDQIAREQELKTAMRKVQEADRFKNAFVANMRDEIRMPLKEIISCVQELVTTTDLERRRDLNREIEICNNQMLKLLDDIIEISREESNE